VRSLRISESIVYYQGGVLGILGHVGQAWKMGVGISRVGAFPSLVMMEP
jgi:hypothetical protein